MNNKILDTIEDTTRHLTLNKGEVMYDLIYWMKEAANVRFHNFRNGVRNIVEVKFKTNNQINILITKVVNFDIAQEKHYSFRFVKAEKIKKNLPFIKTNTNYRAYITQEEYDYIIILINKLSPFLHKRHFTDEPNQLVISKTKEERKKLLETIRLEEQFKRVNKTIATELGL